MNAIIIIGALVAWCACGVLLIRTQPDLRGWLAMMSDARSAPAPVFWAALAALALCGPLSPFIGPYAAAFAAMAVAKIMRLK